MHAAKVLVSVEPASVCAPKRVCGVLSNLCISVFVYLSFSSSVDNQFQNAPLFQGALKVAFETIMNTDVGTLTNAEYLATFCDRMLKKGGEKLSENQVEQRLENIVSRGGGGGGGGGGGRSTPEIPPIQN